MKLKTITTCIPILLLCWGLSSVHAQPAPLTLPKSLRLSLAHSPALKAAEAETEKLSWVVKENQAAYLPTLSVNHSQNRTRPVPDELPQDSRSSYLEAKTTLYSGGLTESAVAQARNLYDGARYNLAHTRQQVITNTHLSYYQVLQSEKNLTLANESVQRLQQHLDIVRAQYDEGTAIKSDVLRTEVELAQARQNYNKGKNARHMALSQLTILIGLPADQEVATTDMGLPPPYKNSVNHAVETALLCRQDLQQLLQEEKAAKDGIEMAKSGHRPTVSLSVKKEWQNKEGFANPWSVQMDVSFTLFDGNKTDAKIKQAEWNQVKTGQIVQQKREQIIQEAKEAYYQLQNAVTAMEIASQVTAKAEEDFAIALVRYQAGFGTNLDVIDAQSALTSAKLNFTNARYDCSKFTIQLYQAMGTITEEDIYANQPSTEKDTH